MNHISANKEDKKIEYQKNTNLSSKIKYFPIHLQSAIFSDRLP